MVANERVKVISMKINPVHKSNPVQNYLVNSELKPGKTENKMGVDEVSFSEEAKNFSKTIAEVREKVNAGIPEDRARIKDIAGKIRSGEYKIDSGIVAEKMIQSILIE